MNAPSFDLSPPHGGESWRRVRDRRQRTRRHAARRGRGAAGGNARACARRGVHRRHGRHRQMGRRDADRPHRRRHHGVHRADPGRAGHARLFQSDGLDRLPRPSPARALRRARLRRAAVHEQALGGDRVLQSRRRDHVQGLRRPRREARAQGGSACGVPRARQAALPGRGRARFDASAAGGLVAAVSGFILPASNAAGRIHLYRLAIVLIALRPVCDRARRAGDLRRQARGQRIRRLRRAVRIPGRHHADLRAGAGEDHGRPAAGALRPAGRGARREALGRRARRDRQARSRQSLRRSSSYSRPSVICRGSPTIRAIRTSGRRPIS